jgi:hypothetical protein
MEMRNSAPPCARDIDGVPPGVAPADNEAGWRMALDRLAKLVEA